MKSFPAGGRAVIVANSGGKFYAIGTNAPTSAETCLRGSWKEPTCPRHGFQFDVVTGNRVKWPASKNEPAYEIKIEGRSPKAFYMPVKSSVTVSLSLIAWIFQGT